MSSIILVNEELREENERLKQTIDLMAKYRICLIDFKDNCNCDKNLSNKLLVELLEKEWTQFKDNERHQRSQQLATHPSIIRPVAVQTDPLECHPSSGHHLTSDMITDEDISVEQIVVIDGSDCGEETNVCPLIVNRLSIGSQTDAIDSHQSIGHHLTVDEITGCRSNGRIIVIDNSGSEQVLDDSPLVRNAIESVGEDVAEGIDEELVPTADTSMTLRSTTVRTRRSTTGAMDSVGNRKQLIKCGQSGCDRSFVYNIQLNQHMKRAHPKCCQYSCVLCPNTYRLLKQLRSHVNDSHSQPISGQRLSAIDEKRERNRCRLPDRRGYRCHRTYCWRVFRSVTGFTAHMRFHRGDYRFGCNECHKRFVDSNKLKQHKKWSHNKSNTNAFECQYTDCHFKTKNNNSLKSHQLIHENKRSFKCPITGCKYRFNTNSGLRQHKVMKHGFKRRKRISH